jgi:hypothetical protein
MAKTIATKPKKRIYRTVTKESLKEGKNWKILLPLDHDVAVKILEEKDDSPGGGEFIKIINSRLRKAYGLKNKK